MLVIIVILLLFGVVVRHKWRNAAARTEEILKLVAEEEAEMAKLRYAEDCYSTINVVNRNMVMMSQAEKNHCCAVCYCPSTTRCSQCKAVRYCSAKCQIIHWRQGHKEQCRPCNGLPAYKEGGNVVGRASDNQLAMNMETETSSSSGTNKEHHNSGSSCDSSLCLSPTEQSEASQSPDKDTDGSVNTHILQTTSDSDDAEVQSPFPSVNPEKMHDAGKISSSKIDERLHSKSSQAKRKGNEPSTFEDYVPCKLKSEHHQSVSRVTEVIHGVSSKTEGGRDFSVPTRGMKTSVQKSTQHSTAPKQSKTSTLDSQKETGENYNQKAIFPLKLFMQLYSCNNVIFHPFGLVNCGNSCYANAVLQSLIFTLPLTSYLLQGLHSRKCHKRGWCFICRLESLIRMGQQTSTPLSPVGLLSQIQTIGKEEDAHEFLRNVVYKMQSICLEEAGVCDSSAGDSTLVGLSFGGYLRSKIKCMRCSGRSERSDRMMDLAVEIDGNIYTLEQALENFTKSETLGGDDKYMCSRCKSYEKAKKKLTVSEAPNILTVVLKRFQSGNLDKLTKNVRFSEILNLSPYMSGTSDRYPVYHLYAVIVHIGVMNAADTGHYVSYVKDFRGDWFRIDDIRVCRVDLSTVLSVEAYILFYARDTPRIPSLISNASAPSDGKTKRTIEEVPSDNGVRKGSTKTLYHEFEMNHNWTPPNDFNVLHESLGYHMTHRNPFADSSSSDSSSIFSVSDAGSYTN